MPTLWELPLEEVEGLRDGLKEELKTHAENDITADADEWAEIQEAYESMIGRYQAEIDRRKL